jgi:hypothetical protein
MIFELPRNRERETDTVPSFGAWAKPTISQGCAASRMLRPGRSTGTPPRASPQAAYAAPPGPAGAADNSTTGGRWTDCA